MYPSVRSRPSLTLERRVADPPPPDPPAPGAAPRRFAADRNVVSLGFTSLFTDVSSQMVAAVLPLYLTIQLGLSSFQFGAFDGLYQAMSVAVAIAVGARADRHRRHKEMAGAGYALSAGCKLGLLASAHWLPTTGFLYLDRTGKGIRTAPRDALISLSAPRHRLAESFGLHRALDTAGALAGPVVAFAILSIAPRAYDAVFACSFLFAVLGLGVLVCFVQNRAPAVAAPPGRTAGRVGSLRASAGLLRHRPFRRLVVCGALVGLLTVSDSFVYLTFQRRASIDLRWFPLLFVGASVVYLVLAVPVGRMADRIGRSRVFVAGQLLLAGTYAVVAFPDPGTVHLFAVFALFGAFYAATDGILAAMAAATLPAGSRATGLAVLTTAVTAAHAAGALAFGWAWSRHGSQATLVVFAAALVGATVLVGRLLRPSALQEATT